MNLWLSSGWIEFYLKNIEVEKSSFYVVRWKVDLKSIHSLGTPMTPIDGFPILLRSNNIHYINFVGYSVFRTLFLTMDMYNTLSIKSRLLINTFPFRLNNWIYFGLRMEIDAENYTLMWFALITQNIVRHILVGVNYARCMLIYFVQFDLLFGAARLSNQFWKFQTWYRYWYQCQCWCWWSDCALYSGEL